MPRIFRIPQKIAEIVLFIGILAGWGVSRGGRIASAAAPTPFDLRMTGLYADFASRTVDPRNLAYSPQYPLWSDGASKRRWIFLPPGTSIDAADPDVWDFPEGTKVWKEFSFHGRPVETRLIERLPDGEWRFQSYAWSADGSEAVLAPAEGLRGVVEIQEGLRHDIPGVLDCRACHVNRQTELLGFSALQLSPDRDPGAPHAEPPLTGRTDLKTLVGSGRIRNFPAGWDEKPPRIAAAGPTGRAALGYLHANCGNCHNSNGSLDALDLLLRHSVAPGSRGEAAIDSAVDRTGKFRIPGAGPGETFLIRPGDPDHSAVLYRMATRNPFRQMPALGTKLADAEAVSLVRKWIREDLRDRNR